MAPDVDEGLGVVLVVETAGDHVELVVTIGVMLIASEVDASVEADIGATVVEAPPGTCTGPVPEGTTKVATIVAWVSGAAF